jgi:hypothetical protein
MLSIITGVPIQDIETEGEREVGFVVKTNGKQEVHVLRMIYNWRVARTSSPFTYDRAWCFYGTDVLTLIRTVQAAIAWDMSDNTAPEGWDKNAMTREYR